MFDPLSRFCGRGSVWRGGAGLGEATSPTKQRPCPSLRIRRARAPKTPQKRERRGNDAESPGRAGPGGGRDVRGEMRSAYGKRTKRDSSSAGGGMGRGEGQCLAGRPRGWLWRRRYERSIRASLNHGAGRGGLPRPRQRGDRGMNTRPNREPERGSFLPGQHLCLPRHWEEKKGSLSSLALLIQIAIFSVR